MISDVLVWIGENPGTFSAFGISALVIGLIIYVAHDIPPPIEEDEHARSRFIG